MVCKQKLQWVPEDIEFIVHKELLQKSKDYFKSENFQTNIALNRHRINCENKKMKIMLSLFFAGKQKVPVMNYSMLCDAQLSGELFCPSEEYKKLSPQLYCIFYLIWDCVVTP